MEKTDRRRLISAVIVFVGAFSTQRRAALPGLGCSVKFARVTRSSPGSDAPHSLNVVSNEQGLCSTLPRPGCSAKNARVARSSPRSGAPHLLNVVSNEQEILGSRHRRSKKNLGSKLRLASWNIGSLTGKLAEVVDVMKRRKVNILCLQETKWVGEKSKTILPWNYKLWYSGHEKNKNGVGIIIDDRLVNDVVEVYRKNDRIMRVKIVCGKDIVNVVSAYAPQVGAHDAIKQKFWEDLDEVVQRIPHVEKLFIGGDLNGHVGASRRDFESVHGGFGYGRRNEEGETILDFAQSYDLILANTWFKKRESHLVTYRSGANATQIDSLDEESG